MVNVNQPEAPAVLYCGAKTAEGPRIATVMAGKEAVAVKSFNVLDAVSVWMTILLIAACSLTGFRTLEHAITVSDDPLEMVAPMTMIMSLLLTVELVTETLVLPYMTVQVLAEP